MSNENMVNNNLPEIDEIDEQDLMGIAGGYVGQPGAGRWDILGKYVLNGGDSLQTVCQYYNYQVTVEMLRKFNHLENRPLKAGMEITVAKWVPNK